MARIRTIKPEFWTDEKVGTLKRDERLLFIGLWNIADDQGVVKANPSYIKGQLFSYDEDLRSTSVNTWLTSLINARMLIPFQFNGEGYFIIRTFEDHQLINRPSKSKFPEEIIEKTINEYSMNTHEVIYEYSQQEGKGKEGNREQGGGVKTRLPKEKKSYPILFRESEIFDKEIFSAALEKTHYETANIDYYHEIMLNWSDSKQAKKVNWLAAAKNWMAKDMTEGKFIKKDFKPPQNGQSNSKAGKQATGANVSTASILSKIAGMPE